LAVGREPLAQDITMTLPLVALVGRPNVGKSSLFNRIVGERLAIVEAIPGTTRDRLYAAADWAGRNFNVVDTGGLEVGEVADMGLRIRNQVTVAVDEADVIVMVVDLRDGVTAADEEVAVLLRLSGKPVVLAANKGDSAAHRHNAADFWSLGLGEPLAISALHGTGSGDLLDAVVAHLPPAEAPADEDAVRIAIVGRPNVGKSSLLNRLLGEDRVIVSPVPGTTRDPIDVSVRYMEHDITLIDTAGIRRRGRVQPGIEKYSVLRAVRAVERADVVALLIDAVDGVTAQDAHVASVIEEYGKGAILCVNKWDLVEKDTHTADAYARTVRKELSFLPYAPVVFMSALTGQRATKVLERALEIAAVRTMRVATGELNRFVAEAQAMHNPPSHKGRPLRIRYATQAGVAPPVFVFFVNDPELVHFTYERFLENQLRARFGYEGTAIRLVFRGGEDRHKDH
jgi:GTPase